MSALKFDENCPCSHCSFERHERFMCRGFWITLLFVLIFALFLCSCTRSTPRPAENADGAILDQYLKDWRTNKKTEALK